MANRKQSFNSICTTVGVRCVKNLVDKFLKQEVRDNEGSFLQKNVMCYANTVSSVKKLVEQFEDHMDGDCFLTLKDVVVIHGSLTREEKAALITEFAESSFSDANFNIL